MLFNIGSENIHCIYSLNPTWLFTRIERILLARNRRANLWYAPPTQKHILTLKWNEIFAENILFILTRTVLYSLNFWNFTRRTGWRPKSHSHSCDFSLIQSESSRMNRINFERIFSLDIEEPICCTLHCHRNVFTLIDWNLRSYGVGKPLETCVQHSFLRFRVLLLSLRARIPPFVTRFEWDSTLGNLESAHHIEFTESKLTLVFLTVVVRWTWVLVTQRGGRSKR